MSKELIVVSQQPAELAEYKPRAGLIQRGLEDTKKALLCRPRIIQVPTDYPSLKLAVDNADDSDIIEIQQGKYAEDVVTIVKALTIRANSGFAHLRKNHETQTVFASLPLFWVDLKHGALTIEIIAFE